jgi:very-short-patch-repair endonuclease
MCDQLASDALVARIAGRQHGVVSTVQLHELGLTKHGIRYRVRAGRLHRIHRGVYAVGHRGVGRKGSWMAAVLAVGPGAVLSHGSAAVHWGLLRPLEGSVHVSIPSAGGRDKRKGICLHRCASLSEAHVTRRNGIPVTTPARTLEDISGLLPERLVTRATRQAELAGLDLGRFVEADGTRSELERMFLLLCRRHGLPPPEVNAKVGGLTVDFLWRRAGLVVETDGYRFHRGRVAFEEDRARDLELKALGLDVIRLSYRQVAERLERVAEVIRQRAP